MERTDGLTHLGLLLGLPVVAVVALVVLDSALNGFTLTDLLGGLITGLVLYLVKKINDVEKRLAMLAERTATNTDEIRRLRQSHEGGR